MIADALGNPLSFTLTGAEQADITQAPALLDAVKAPQAVIADKGYDADTLVEKIEASPTPTSRRARIESIGAMMIIIATKPVISSKTCSRVSSNSAASPHARTN
jgi:IS5 family transposase